MKIKSSAITYTGYDYQTLQGVKILTDWLNSPTKFTRVAFEAEDNLTNAPQGIDDIVCEREDGLTDYWQIKMTPSPEKDENRLSWDWLLKISGKTARSRSILKKISDAINSVPTEKLGNVVLLTNKLPDRSMESCLSGQKINFHKIDKENREKIANQLGSDEKAVYLFERLTVQHSDSDYHVINRTVRDELLKYSNDLGVERLLSRAREWAMFEDNPPKGWITLQQVREVLSPRRPNPIPELFSVPDDYCLPDHKFHDDVLNKITCSKGEVYTITGKPGGGKSTYLSFLCQELEENKIPLIRHHYFLSVNDSTTDRLSPRIVAESLLHQINRFHGKVGADTRETESLHVAIKACANYYQKKGKPFVVLLDGLDHVWRDNAKNKKPLDEIFKQLLPATNNLVVLVGTQNVDNKLLPDLLLKVSPKKDWLTLPEMSVNAVYEFLKSHVDTGRLFLRSHVSQFKEDIQSSARALHQITNGYPLHVIYSTEYLASQGLPLSTWEIDKLPPCSDGNITNYYNDLWQTLSYKQKDVLHLCCNFKFSWPRQAISSILHDNHNNAPSVDAVAHLLSESISGVRPFHESLIVFVKGQSGHKGAVSALLGDVCYWLRNDAPQHLKDSWLWSCLAMQGITSELREGLTRDWVLDRLVHGMPIKSCLRLLSEAENYAFEECKYAEAYKHRELKTRLLNGPEFQIWDSTTLETLSILEADKPAFNELLSRSHEYSSTQLAVLAMAEWHREQTDSAKELSKKAINLYQTKSKLISKRQSDEEQIEVTSLIQAGTLAETLNFDDIFSNKKFEKWPEAYITGFRTACLIKRDIELLLRAWNCLPNDSQYKREIELDLIRLSVLEDAEIESWPEYESFLSQELSGFSEEFFKHSLCDVSTEYYDIYPENHYKIKANQDYHSWFFASLKIRIQAEGDFCWIPVQATFEQTNTSNHYHLLNGLSCYIADKLLLGNELSFDILCHIFSSAEDFDDTGYDAQRANILFRRDWIGIAADFHLITLKRQISCHEIQNVLDNPDLMLIRIYSWYKDLKLDYLSDDAVTALIDSRVRQLEEEIEEETIEKSNTYLELADLAHKNGDTEQFLKLLRKTWDFVLGYGHHKDISVFEVHQAIEYLSEVDSGTALTLLERISPIINSISDFTDGDETRHAPHSLSALTAKFNPQTTASIYDQQLRSGEWYYADETLKVLLEEAQLTSPIIKHLFLTGLPSSCHDALIEMEQAGNQQASGILKDVKNQLGININDLNKQEQSSTDTHHKSNSINPADFPPNSIDTLCDKLNTGIGVYGFLEKWYAYWKEQDKERWLIRELVPRANTFVEPYGDTRYLLDPLFHSQRKLAGKRSAYKLLVFAHQAMQGWSIWYENSKNSINRLKIVAEQYPEKADDFIKATSIRQTSWYESTGNLIIPGAKLVFLLSQCGRIQEAKELTLSMIEGLEQSVRNLNLQQPQWDWGQDDSIADALLKILVARIKHPIPYVKMHVLEQLSELLIANHPKVENLLKQDLASRKQESECVEVLCIFYVAHLKGFTCPKDLGIHIKARSTLSDLLLKEMIKQPCEFGEYIKPIDTEHRAINNPRSFKHNQGTHVPLVYYSNLEREEEKTGLPFTMHYEIEWNATYEYLPAAETQIDYFLSADRQRSTGQFYTQASHRGRSAYLRVIEFAKQNYGMPDNYAEHLAIPALPIDPALLGLKQIKPNWLPEWHVTDDIGFEEITNYIKLMLNNFSYANDSEILLGLSLPLKVNENKWFEISVVRATNLKATDNISTMEDVLWSLYQGTLLESELSYQYLNEEQNHLGIMAAESFPYNRYGHWHSNSRNFFVPLLNVNGNNITGKSQNKIFCYYNQGIKIGHSSFWYDNWSHCHPIGVTSLSGTYTAFDKEQTSLFEKDTNVHAGYVCKIKSLSAKQSYDKFKEEKHEFVLLDQDL